MTQIERLEVVDTTRYPSFFVSFEIKDCWNTMETVVQAALDDVIQKCTKPGTRERKRALYMHDNPAGNLFALSFGLCEAERLAFVVRYLNYLCIIDDVLEDLPHKESVIEHEILSQVLHLGPPSSPPLGYTPNTRHDYISYLRDMKDEMMIVDPVRTPALLERLEEGLRVRESSDADFNNIDEYVPYRLHNFDYDTVSRLMLWAMDIDISPEQLDSDLLSKVKYSTGVIGSLSNDYFSWEREKLQHGSDVSRIRNAVGVLMKQHDISEAEAKAEVKSIIIKEENNVKSLVEHCEEMSPAVKRYLEGLQTFAGGYGFWCATCPRYSRPKGDSS
ncbi:hypothetical protein PQX77_022104 [Marasmius sp. AFHP31]|nr:hypothetical protein PQX77_022104 [Marasmius sp. AFHP31]